MNSVAEYNVITTEGTHIIDVFTTVHRHEAFERFLENRKEHFDMNHHHFDGQFDPENAQDTWAEQSSKFLQIEIIQRRVIEATKVSETTFYIGNNEQTLVHYQLPDTPGCGGVVFALDLDFVVEMEEGDVIPHPYESSTYVTFD